MFFEVFIRKIKRCARTSSINNVFVLKRKESWCQQNCLPSSGRLIFTCCCAHCMLTAKYGIIWIAVIPVRVTVINKLLVKVLEKLSC